MNGKPAAPEGAGPSSMVSPFWRLLRDNPNYRYTWMGQVVSEVGDHFNSIAVLSLALHVTGSGLAVGMVMIARTLPAILAGPVAGVALDRFDRKRIMIASDLFRAVVALAYVLILTHNQGWLLYLLSGMLMFASPFFTSGRSAVLPRITTAQELHTANALTQTTAWLTLTIGTMLGGISTMQFGYEWAFVANSLSFVFSAWAVARLKSPTGNFKPSRTDVHRHTFREWWNDYVCSLRYIRRTPLVLAIALVGVGWATGGGAAQILFTIFGEVVFQRGPAGIGLIWGFAGIGLVAGGLLGHRLGARLNFRQYKHAVSICFFVHGAAYTLFAVMPNIWLTLIWIAISRMGVGVNNVLNRTMLLTHVPDSMRGRVFSTVEMAQLSVMMLSLGAGGIATQHYDPRWIGVIAGILSGSTAIFWFIANAAGKLPEPQPQRQESESDFPASVNPA